MQDPIRKIFTENPLLLFSTYTHLHAEVIRSLGRDICCALDASISLSTEGTTQVDGTVSKQVWGKFWLWVLGSYEVVRTTSQAKGCFTEALSQNFLFFKRKIAKLRIPFAKQEYAQGGPNPIQAEASIYGFDVNTRDMLYHVQGTTFSVKELIAEFDTLIGGVKIADVIHRHGWQHIAGSKQEAPPNP